jgi:hypothetical protein
MIFILRKSNFVWNSFETMKLTWIFFMHNKQGRWYRYWLGVIRTADSFHRIGNWQTAWAKVLEDKSAFCFWCKHLNSRWPNVCFQWIWNQCQLGWKRPGIQHSYVLHWTSKSDTKRVWHCIFITFNLFSFIEKNKSTIYLLN